MHVLAVLIATDFLSRPMCLHIHLFQLVSLRHTVTPHTLGAVLSCQHCT
jgi:hypothetical protein